MISKIIDKAGAIIGLTILLGWMMACSPRQEVVSTSDTSSSSKVVFQMDGCTVYRVRDNQFPHEDYGTFYVAINDSGTASDTCMVSDN